MLAFISLFCYYNEVLNLRTRRVEVVERTDSQECIPRIGAWKNPSDDSSSSRHQNKIMKCLLVF